MEKQGKTKQFYMHKIANLLNVQKIVTIHYQELDKTYASEEETHDFWELIYADKENVSSSSRISAISSKAAAKSRISLSSPSSAVRKA